MVAESVQPEPSSRGAPAESFGDLAADLYDKLRAAAHALLAREPAGGSLAGTAVVHEAWLRLKLDKRRNWISQADFCAAAVQVIRHILVDHARRRRARKRGGDGQRVMLDSGVLAIPAPHVDVIDLNDALQRLAALDARRARVVELRFFGGLSTEETALALGVSPRTVQIDWRGSRAWLRRELSHDPDSSGSRS